MEEQPVDDPRVAAEDVRAESLGYVEDHDDAVGAARCDERACALVRELNHRQLVRLPHAYALARRLESAGG